MFVNAHQLGDIHLVQLPLSLSKACTIHALDRKRASVTARATSSSNRACKRDARNFGQPLFAMSFFTPCLQYVYWLRLDLHEVVTLTWTAHCTGCLRIGRVQTSRLNTAAAMAAGYAGLDPDHALSVATSAADAAGHMIREAFNQPKSVEHKGKVGFSYEASACRISRHNSR